MLRVSAQTTDTEIDIQAINGSIDAAEVGIDFGSELLRFAEALATRDDQSLLTSRQTLLATAGHEALVDAAGVAANFQRMVRIADSIGIPVDDMSTELGQSVRRDLDLERFTTAQNTLTR